MERPVCGQRPCETKRICSRPGRTFSNDVVRHRLMRLDINTRGSVHACAPLTFEQNVMCLRWQRAYISVHARTNIHAHTHMGVSAHMHTYTSIGAVADVHARMPLHMLVCVWA
jgi:hypothetical protein